MALMILFFSETGGANLIMDRKEADFRALLHTHTVSRLRRVTLICSIAQLKMFISSVTPCSRFDHRLIIF